MADAPPDTGPPEPDQPDPGPYLPPPEAAVIIPHYDDVVRLIRCLAALMPQVTAGVHEGMAGPVEVVVVDNGSTQSLEAVRAAHPTLRIVTEPRKGAAMARNRGVAVTTARRLFFLDCDCVPAPDWLAMALRVADSADIVGGTVTLFDETPPPRSGAEAFETVFAFDNRGYIARKGFSVTANLLTRRDVFVATGDFVPGLSEDLDWCRRATGLGFALVHAPGLCAAHPTRADWTALAKKWHRLTAEGFGVNGTTPAARLTWAARALAMPVSILAHAPKILVHPRLNGPAERMAALATLARLRFMRMGWMLRQAAGRRV